MKLLIAGDSFAVDYSKYNNIEYKGWPNLLAETINVDNVAQAGVSQYSILKQIEKIHPLEYDKIIVSVTSPNRIFCRQHPIHTSGIHENCDLIYNDIDRFSLFNSKLKTAKNWFKYFFDEEYSVDIYNLITDRIHFLLQNTDYILISHNTTPVKVEDIFNFEELWKYNNGLVNHYNEQGNQTVYKTLLDNFINK